MKSKGRRKARGKKEDYLQRLQNQIETDSLPQFLASKGRRKRKKREERKSHHLICSLPF